MPLYKDFKTIPQLFNILTLEFGKGKERPVLKYKVDDNWNSITYDQLYEETVNFACGLATLGVRKEVKVAIIAENRPEWVFSDMAILGLGAIDVPLYPISTSESLEFILNNSESVGIIVSNKFQLNKVLKIKGNCKNLKFIVVMNNSEKGTEKDVYSFSDVQNMGKGFRREQPNYFSETSSICSENQLCTIIYTSGTTGEPKGVLLTHKNIVSNIKATHEIFHLDENDVFLSFLPLCHIFEIGRAHV